MKCQLSVWLVTAVQSESAPIVGDCRITTKSDKAAKLSCHAKPRFPQTTFVSSDIPYFFGGMGKAKKRERKVHTNHHDRPRHRSTGIVRRSHSQTVSKKPGSSKLQAARPGAKAVARARVPFSNFDHVLCVGEGMCVFY